MKKFFVIIFVLSSFTSFGQNCEENEPTFSLIIITKEAPESYMTLISQYNEIEGLYDTYKIWESECLPSPPTVAYHLFGCGDGKIAEKDFEETDLFNSVSLTHNVPIVESFKTKSLNGLKIQNPVHEVLYLTFPNRDNEIKIFDMQGGKIMQQNVGFSAEINVLSLKTGTYVLVVNGESYKFVKE